MRNVVLLLVALLLSACDEEQKRLPRASGAQGEVLVVMDKGLWESDAGAALRGELEQVFPRLPQREPHFKVAQVPHAAFGDLLRVHRNLLLTDIGPQFDSAAVHHFRDRFALGQEVVQITAPDASSWTRVLQQNAERVRGLFDQAERQRLQDHLRKENEPAIEAGLRDRYGIGLLVPKGFREARTDAHVTWLRRDREMSSVGLMHVVQEGILVYVHPYTSDSTFTPKALVDMRDSVLHMYVEGPDPGTYMRTQRGFDDIDLMPETRSTTLDGRFAMEMRGLWTMQGIRMGGPFLSLSTVDATNDRVITVEGYLYAPQFDKREMLRELEAVVYSLVPGPDPMP